MKITQLFQNEKVNNETTNHDIENFEGKIYLSRVIDNNAPRHNFGYFSEMKVNKPNKANKQNKVKQFAEKLIIINTKNGQHCKQTSYLYNYKNNDVDNFLNVSCTSERTNSTNRTNKKVKHKRAINKVNDKTHSRIPTAKIKNNSA